MNSTTGFKGSTVKGKTSDSTDDVNEMDNDSEIETETDENTPEKD
jgi:hypothetical protein